MAYLYLYDVSRQNSEKNPAIFFTQIVGQEICHNYETFGILFCLLTNFFSL